ncbi:energy transducer TonB [Caballeronia sp. 15711]|uniref:energy transducer TonB n=1 Tax=Caballeronia sp. 15711 TaxID=3391029 RepID=UPI0039E6AF4D
MSIAESQSVAVIQSVRHKRAVNGKLWAALVAVLLHVGLLALAYRVHHDLVLTAGARPGGALRVTLVAPAKTPAVQPPKPQVQPPVQKPVPQKKKILATHRVSPRQIAVADPTPERKDFPIDAPVVTQQTPSTASAQPAAAAAQTAIPLPTPGDAGKNAHLNCDIPAPPYPARARRLGHEGAVQLAVTIDASGHIITAQVQKSSGYEELDEAAQQAMLSGHCDPLIQAGRAVPTTAVQPLSFHLDN